MEHTGASPSMGIRSTELADVARWDGPFLSVLLETRAALEHPSQVSEGRWQIHRDRLVAQGADSRCIEMVDGIVSSAHLGGDGLGVVATPDGRMHVEHHAEAPDRERAEWSTVPSLAMLIEWRQQALPYVLVLIDHRGADLVAVVREQSRAPVEAGVRDYPLTKTAPGGWSQHRYQRRAENTWRDNAEDAAAMVTGLAGEIGAQLVLIAGDERVSHMLLGDLPRSLAEQARLIPGGREPIEVASRMGEEVDRQIRSVAAEHTVAVLEAFHNASGQAGRATDGPGPTLAALAEANVETLLVHDDVDDRRTAWMGTQPGEVAMEEAELRELGVGRFVQGRLVDVAVAEALRSGSGVRVVPSNGGPAGGLGAILRWREEAR